MVLPRLNRKTLIPQIGMKVRSYIRNPKTIFHKLFLCFGGAACAVLLTVNWIHYFTTRAALEKQIDVRVISELQNGALQFDLFIQKCGARVEPILSRELTSGRCPPGEMREFLVDLLARTPENEAFDFYVAYEHFDYRDPNANLLVDRVSWPKTYKSTYDYHDPKQEWYHTPKVTGERHLTEPYFDLGAVNRSMISYTIPIIDKSGKFIGVAGVDIVLDSLDKILDRIYLRDNPCVPSDYSIFLVSKSGKLVSHRDKSLLPSEESEGKYLREMVEGRFVGATDEGYAVAKINGEMRRIYWTTAPFTGWKLILNVSNQSLMGSIHNLSEHMLVVSVLALIAMLLVVLISTIYFSKPIQDMERKVQQAQKLEAVGTMAGGIAHDFNNILCAIMGYAELGQITAKERTQEQQYFREILKASNRARDLIRQILMFSRKAKASRKPISLQPVVGDALKLLRSMLPTTIELDAHIEGDLPEVEADATQIHQILMNLVTNASHAIGSKAGVIKVSLSRAHVSGSVVQFGEELLEGEYVRIGVKDDGCGMDEKTLEKIFDPFFTTKEPGKGTGLGLAVVHGIIREHHGAITVSSKLGEGTTFHVYLPALPDVVVKEVKVPEVVKAVGHGEHILVVEDEAAIRDVMSHALTYLGYRATILSSPIVALEEFKKDPDAYDLVFTDLAMPGMNGVEFTERVRGIRKDIPIVMATGHMNDLVMGKPEHIHTIILKPLAIDVLGEILQKVLVEKRVS